MAARGGLLLVAALVLGGCGAPGPDEDAVVPDPDGTYRYVALGDSCTSAPFVPDPVPAGGCQRSTSSSRSW